MQDSSWPIWGLLSTVFGSILEVGLLCVAGYILAQHGILDKRTQKHVNRLNVSLFTPSLLFSKVAFSLTPGKLKELWTIPIVFVVTTAGSMSVAYALGSILRLKKSQRSFAIAASMFMNSNSLPIALMQSMVYSVRALHWGDDDNEDAMLGRALTYLVTYSTMGMIVRWSYGVHLLSQADADEVSPLLDEGQHVSETTPLFQEASTHVPLDASNQRGTPTLIFTHSYGSLSSGDSTSPDQPYSPNSLTQADHTRFPPQAESHLAPRYFTSFPNSPVYSRSETSESDATDDEENQNLPAGNISVRRIRTRRSHILRRMRVFFHKLNSFMTVPMWAALASIIVVCVRPLQHALETHMQPIRLALNSAGNCSIPLTLVVLGAYFYVPNLEEESCAVVRTVKPRRSDASLIQSVRRIFVLRGQRKRKSRAGIVPIDVDTGDIKRPGETKTVVVAVLSRMVLTPLILLPLLALFMASGATAVFDDPVFALSNVLLITSAPALTLAQITQAASGDAFERLISRTIFWAYCVVTPVSTLVAVVIGLLLAKI